MVPEIAVFVRTLDGPYQQLLMRQNARGHSLAFLETLHGMAAPHPFTPCAQPRSYIRTITEIASPVCLFLNRPLTTINAFFIDVLLREAMRSDCGLVSGIAVDLNRRILGSGELFDSTSACALGQPALEVSGVTEVFFALRRECLAAAGGLSLLSPSGMGRAVASLSDEARRRGLKVLATPLAVGTVLFT